MTITPESVERMIVFHPFLPTAAGVRLELGSAFSADKFLPNEAIALLIQAIAPEKISCVGYATCAELPNGLAHFRRHVTPVSPTIIQTILELFAVMISYNLNPPQRFKLLDKSCFIQPNELVPNPGNNFVRLDSCSSYLQFFLGEAKENLYNSSEGTRLGILTLDKVRKMTILFPALKENIAVVLTSDTGYVDQFLPNSCILTLIDAIAAKTIPISCKDYRTGQDIENGLAHIQNRFSLYERSLLTAAEIVNIDMSQSPFNGLNCANRCRTYLDFFSHSWTPTASEDKMKRPCSV